MYFLREKYFWFLREIFLILIQKKKKKREIEREEDEAAMEALRERAAFVRESLQKSQTITDSMVSILGSFDYRLSALETAMRPTQVCLFSFIYNV